MKIKKKGILRYLFAVEYTPNKKDLYNDCDDIIWSYISDFFYRLEIDIRNKEFKISNYKSKVFSEFELSLKDVKLDSQQESMYQLMGTGFIVFKSDNPFTEIQQDNLIKLVKESILDK